MARIMKRKRSVLRDQRDQPILNRIRIIKSDHPLWGYRRIWAYMRYRDGRVIGKNRVYRLMKEHQLLVKPNTRLKAKRGHYRSKPVAQTPNQLWGMDMTKVRLNQWGWIYVHVVLDWYTKEIVGTSVSITSKTDDWLNALNHAVNTRFPDGILAAKHSLSLVTDNGCQPTAQRFMKSCATIGIKQIFTTWNNPKGNADTERVFRTLKEDLVWTHDWNLPFEFQSSFDHWVSLYNSDFPHQALNYKTPQQFMAIATANHTPQSVPIF